MKALKSWLLAVGVLLGAAGVEEQQDAGTRPGPFVPSGSGMGAGAGSGMGAAATTAYAKLQFGDMAPLERDRTNKALLRYCEMGTLAMVMVY
jgi:hypothetical protein